MHADPAAEPRTADEAKADEQYSVVWLPPLFKARIAALVALLWLAICAAVVCALVLPLVLGRCALRVLFTAPLHDFYPFCLGLGMLLGAAAAATSTYKACRRVQRAPNVRRRLRRTMLVRLRLRGLKLLRRLWIIFAVSDALTPQPLPRADAIARAVRSSDAALHWPHGRELPRCAVPPRGDHSFDAADPLARQSSGARPAGAAPRRPVDAAARAKRRARNGLRRGADSCELAE